MGYFNDLYRNNEAGFLTIWTLQDKRCRFFKCPDEINAADDYAIQASKTMDVYYGVGLRNEQLGEYRRGGEGDIASIPALYLDFDVAHGSSDCNAYHPESKEELMAFIDELPLTPSRIIGSGNGYHCYWDLKEPLIISNDTERAEVKMLLSGWNDFVNRFAERYGYRFDKVGELARVLRIPGTLNHKSDPPLPVEIIIENNRTYDPSHFESYIEDSDRKERMLPNPFKMPDKVMEGERNNMLFSLGCSLRGKSMCKKAVEAALFAENEEKCHPPLNNNEVRSIVKSACRYEPGAVNKGDNGKMKNLDEATEYIDLEGIPLEGLKKPHWSIDEESGVFRSREVNGKMILEKACSHPLIITEVISNIETGLEKVRLGFKKHGTWRSFETSRSVIASRQNIVAPLADRGVSITSENAKHTVKYLEEFEEANKHILIPKRGIARAGWIDEQTFSPYYGDIKFDGEDNFGKLFKAISRKGDRSKNIEVIIEAKKQIESRTAVAASFASALMRWIGLPPFYVHFWGSTGKGKSALLKIQASIWGDYNELVRTFNATKVGLEKAASFLHSLPLSLDELQTRDDRMNMDKQIYTLTEGKSKGRGTRDGGAEATSYWYNIIISNGEDPITGSRSGGGAKNRAVEIYLKNNLFGGNGRELVNIAAENYGYIGQAYITNMIEAMKNDTELILKSFNMFRNKFAEMEKADSIYTDKQWNFLAVLATGDYLGARFGLGMDAEEAELAAWEFAWKLTGFLKGSDEVDEVVRRTEWYIGELASNSDHFLPGVNCRSPRHGVIETRDGKQYVYVIASVLNKQLTDAAINPDKIIKGWVESGFIQRSDDLGHIAVVKKLDGMSVRCYRFVLSEDTKEDE